MSSIWFHDVSFMHSTLTDTGVGILAGHRLGNHRGLRRDVGVVLDWSRSLGYWVFAGAGVSLEFIEFGSPTMSLVRMG